MTLLHSNNPDIVVMQIFPDLIAVKNILQLVLLEPSNCLVHRSMIPQSKLMWTILVNYILLEYDTTFRRTVPTIIPFIRNSLCYVLRNFQDLSRDDFFNTLFTY